MALLKGAAPFVDLPESPNHPPSTFIFLKREFGKKQVRKYSCQASWFKTWKWLHYNEQKDTVFCHVCVQTLQSKLIDVRRGEPFTIAGFGNWKDGTVGMKKHKDSTSHKEAVEVMVIIPSSCPYVAEMLSKEHAAQKKENRQCLLKILSTLQFLGRQGIALRGDGNESDSNFVQLLKLCGNDDLRIETWLLRKTDKYFSQDIQKNYSKLWLCPYFEK